MKISSSSNTFDSQKTCQLTSASAGCVTVTTNMTIDESKEQLLKLVSYKKCRKLPKKLHKVFFLL